MKEIRTEIEIHASPERVWSIVTDLARYAEWNPLVPRATGTVQKGARLDVTIEAVAGKPRSVQPVVTLLDPARRLRWRAGLLAPWFFTSEHGFSIEVLGPNRVRFVNDEVFEGALVALIRSTLEREARPGFEKMNEALKRRAEAA